MTVPSDATAADELAHLRRTNAELVATIDAQRRETEQLRHQLQQLLRRLYGPRSERVHPDQPTLFGDPPPESVPLPPPPSDAPASPLPTPHGRRRLAKDLPRRRVEHDLSDAEKCCPGCGTIRVRIGEDVTERLEYRPASAYVLEDVRPKYVCRACGDHACAEPVPVLLPKALAGPGLLAHVVVSKLTDHLPLHRLERILGRGGIALSRSTLGDWMAGCAAAVTPLYESMCERVRHSAVIHTDDTPVTTLAPRHPAGRVTSRVWVYLGDAAHPYTVFDATPSRSRDGPAQFLGAFRGFLQADAFGGYDGLYAQGVTEVACWAHARRKFVEAKATAPAEAHEALARIRGLYDVEATAKTLDVAARTALRQAESVPLLAAMRGWLDALRAKALPKSPLGQAVTYALNQWSALVVYARDGRLAIDNNAAERALRSVAVGRKNWTFFGSASGARTAAVLMSLTASCARHGIDPWAYLTDLFTRWPSTPLADREKFLPDAWAARHAAAALTP